MKMRRMICFIDKLLRDCRGVVAVETVLTIPLYLILLGGGVWLTEAVVGKSTLFIAESAHLGLLNSRGREGSVMATALGDGGGNSGLLAGLLLQGTSSNVSFTFDSGGDSYGGVSWWREEKVFDTVTIPQSNLTHTLMNVMSPQSNHTAKTTTMSGPSFTRRTRVDWGASRRNAVDGAVLCAQGVIRDICSEPMPGYNGSDARRGGTGLSIANLGYYRSSEELYHAYLY